jgi:hypothetical protein
MVQPRSTAHAGHGPMLATALVVLLAGCSTGMPSGSATSSLTPSVAPSTPTPSTATLVSPAPSPAIAMRQVAGLTDFRYAHTATLLRDGRVLVVGGRQLTWDTASSIHAGTLASVEVFDPATATWASGPALHEARSAHTATLLTDGRVLVVGGFSESTSDYVVHSAELFDPTTSTWTLLKAPLGAGDHSATLLGDGRVLVVGWPGGTVTGDSWAIFDPTTARWTAPKSTALALPFHTAIALRDGSVLAAGGTHPLPDGPPPPNAAAARFDPATGMWAAVPSMHSPRLGFAAILLRDGRVLAVDGGSAELFDPVTNTWSSTGSPISPRLDPVAVALADGRVLVVGEHGTIDSKAIVEIYDPTSAAFSEAAPFPVTEGPTATRLLDGRVLIAGGLETCFYGTGCSNDTLTGDAYLFDPAAAR